MLLGRRVRLEVNKAQENACFRFAGTNRFAWNESLTFYEKLYKEKGKFYLDIM